MAGANAKKTILVIEDEPHIVMGLRDSLEFEGFAVISAGKGKDGIQLARAESPDAVVLDLMLPDINGYAVCEEIRRINAFVPIIMLTARSQETDKIRGLDAGADDYVTKPFSVNELIARMRAIFRRAQRPSASPELVDIGDAKDIHPRDKKTVGERLAAWALATEYGRPIAVWSSPVVESVERAQMTTGEKGIRVRFRHGEGLKARTGEAIDGFAIAGPDGTFVWAKAMVDAKSSDPADHASVVVWAEGIADPVEVAYAWQNNPVKANLVNGAGWPAGPFKGKVK